MPNLSEAFKNTAIILWSMFIVTNPVRSQEISDAAPIYLTGDLGLADSYAPSPARSVSSSHHLVPYASFDYGPFFGRVDTFGVDTVELGYGHLELVTRFVEEGYVPAPTFNGEFDRRKSSIPFGIGTLQIMPAGAIILNAYHDLNKTHGNLVDLIFAEQVKFSRFTFYPQAGAEYRSRDYVQYYYGVSGAEALRTKTNAYQTGDAVNLFMELMVEARIAGNWFVNANVRKTRLDSSIADSPLVDRRFCHSALVSFSYRFE